ncbi:MULTISPECIES: hypothetical protein [unclassified Mycobacterium]|uniref:hypothetical protein n=1 Tax=unclassified Mycobacterium TaxID=2642494 RepID=UPI0029C6644A|nr:MULTISPECIES: hypothetical protein [unclassified Mycobacterium]
MAVRPLEATDRVADGVHKLDRASMRRLERARARAKPPAHKFRLTVLAASVADVVWCAGGWLYDRAVMGWDVEVAVAECPDDRPLHILGARLVELDHVLGKASPAGVPDALSVSVGLYERDARVQRYTTKEIGSNRTEVTLWGRDWPTELSRLRPVEHRLSLAAQAFKAQAMAAAGESPDLGGVAESFRICRRHLSPTRDTPDLELTI